MHSIVTAFHLRKHVFRLKYCPLETFPRILCVTFCKTELQIETCTLFVADLLKTEHALRNCPTRAPIFFLFPQDNKSKFSTNVCSKIYLIFLHVYIASRVAISDSSTIMRDKRCFLIHSPA